MSEEKPKATLERVPISKLRPNKDNVRKEFGDLDAFAAEFDDNPVYPGEPWQPLIVYRDANVFRIVDGERRYRAMKKAGKVKECNAYVFDTMDDAVAVLVMLDTNSKQLLNENEFSFGLQMALILGIPEERVDVRAGSKVSAAVKRQIARQGGKAAQMSIEQMIAADEYADDPEAYERIVKADSHAWYAEYRTLKRKREEAQNKAKTLQAATDAVEAYGLQVVEKPPKGAILERTLYGSDASEIIRKSAEEWSKVGFILAMPRENKWGSMTSWEVYSLPPDRTPEEEAAAKSKSALRRQVQLGRKRRLEWVAERMLTVGANEGLRNVRRFTRDYIMGTSMYDVEEFCKKADMDSDFFNDSGAFRIPNEYVIAENWQHMDYMTNAEVDDIGFSKDMWASTRHSAAQHVKLLNAMRNDGYEPTDEESAFIQLCINAQQEGKRDDD